MPWCYFLLVACSAKRQKRKNHMCKRRRSGPRNQMASRACSSVAARPMPDRKSILIYYCPKQLLSASFPQPNPLICNSADGHCKTRSMTARASCPKRWQAWRPGTETRNLLKHGALRPSRSYSLTRKEAPTVRSLSKTKLTKSCFGHD